MSRTPGPFAPRHEFAGAVIVTAILAMVASLFLVNAKASESPLNLGTASTYGVLASAAVTAATSSSVSGTAGGDLGVGGATAPTGTILVSGATVLGGSSLAALTAASNALADNRGGTSTGVELGAGRTITPGAYTNGTLEINGTLTLDAQNDPNAVFIFRAASTLVTGTSSSVVLTNGAQACNVYWQIGSSATLGASSTMVGHVIASASISTGATSTVNGQLIAITGAVTLGGTSISNSSCSTSTPPPATEGSSATPSAEPRVVWSTYFDSCEVSTGFAPDGVGVFANTNASFTLPGNVGSLTNPAKVAPMVRDGYRFIGWATTQGATLPIASTFTPTGNTTLCAVWEALPVVATPTPEATPTVEATPEATPTVEATPEATPTVEATATPSPVTTTETGGLLPTTATPWINLLLIGGILIALGVLIFGARKVMNR